MHVPRVEKGPDGAFLVRHIPPVLALALDRLPGLLAEDGPGAGRRIRETPFPGDDEAAEQWKRYAVPELEHLFAAARDVVVKDLRGLERDGRWANGSRLKIPAGHLAAWLSSLAAVRVALGETHGFTAAEMEAALPPAVTSEREQALLLVHLLGWMQGILVEAGA